VNEAARDVRGAFASGGGDRQLLSLGGGAGPKLPQHSMLLALLSSSTWWPGRGTSS